MALFTLTQLKTYLAISGSSEDSQLAFVVAGVSKSVEKFLKRTLLEVAGITEYHSGHNRQRLYLRSRPATTITSVKVDSSGYFGQGSGAFASDTAITQGTDWAVESTDEDERNQSCLIYLRGVWPEGDGNIKVVYTAGYSSTPDDVLLSCLEIAAAVRAAIGSAGPLQSEDLGDYSYQLMTDTRPGKGVDLRQAMHRLRPYREVIA